MPEIKAKTEWWANDGGFFGDLFIEADNSVEGPFVKHQDLRARTIDEIKGIVRLADIKKGDKVLDCPCGYGRHSLVLAELGYNVTGIDVNKRFIDICNKRRAKLNLLNSQFIEKDMREIEFEGEFDAVINLFNSLGYFSSEEDDLKAIKNFYKALKPGGRFLTHHTFTPEKAQDKMNKMHYDVRTLQSGRKVEIVREYNPSTKRMDSQWTLIDKEGAREEMVPTSTRVYSDAEWREMFDQAGFSQVQRFDNWEGKPAWYASDQLIMVGIK